MPVPYLGEPALTEQVKPVMMQIPLKEANASAEPLKEASAVRGPSTWAVKRQGRQGNREGGGESPKNALTHMRVRMYA